VHGTLNGIGQWFVAGLGGIRRRDGGVGYQHFELRPPFHAHPEVTEVSASYISAYGLIKSSYTVKAGGLGLTYQVTVPPNTLANLHLPASSPSVVTEGGKPAAQAVGVKFVSFADGIAVYLVGSGVYSFASIDLSTTHGSSSSDLTGLKKRRVQKRACNRGRCVAYVGREENAVYVCVCVGGGGA
jgi:alpha-L-rhamnosidase